MWDTSHFNVDFFILDIFNLFFFILNMMTSPDELWFYWPLLGWGIGVLFHGMKVFNYSPFFNKDWEERKIKEYMDKENSKKYE